MKLSKYPKKGISFSQLKDAEKIEKERKKQGINLKCQGCGNDKFMITTLGLEVCSKCLTATGNFIL